MSLWSSQRQEDKARVGSSKTLVVIIVVTITMMMTKTMMMMSMMSMMVYYHTVMTITKTKTGQVPSFTLDLHKVTSVTCSRDS